jgi:hypothetical protein
VENWLFILLVLNFNSSCDLQGLNNQQDCPKKYDAASNRYVYTYTQQMPKYPGGLVELFRYIQKKFAFKNGEFQGEMDIEFVVDVDGSLSALRIKGKNKEDLTPAEKRMLRVLQSSPKWISGKCNGKNVPIETFLPIRF